MVPKMVLSIAIITHDGPKQKGVPRDFFFGIFSSGFFLRDLVTPGLNSTIGMECSHREMCLCGNGIYTFPWCGSGILLLVQDVFVRAREFTFITRPRVFWLDSTAVG